MLRSSVSKRTTAHTSEKKKGCARPFMCFFVILALSLPRSSPLAAIFLSRSCTYAEFFPTLHDVESRSQVKPTRLAPKSKIV